VKLAARADGPLLIEIVRQQPFAIEVEGPSVLADLITAAGGGERSPERLHVEPQSVC